MELIRRAATEGTGLAPGESALIAACAAAVRGHPRLLRESLELALEHGLPKEQAWAAPAVVLISRGQPVAERLAEALIEVFGDPDPGAPDDGPLDHAGALAYFQRYFDGIPPRISLLAEKSQTAFEGYTRLHRGALREGPLPGARRADPLRHQRRPSSRPTSCRSTPTRLGARARATTQLFGAVLSVIPVSGAAAWPGAAAALRSG